MPSGLAGAKLAPIHPSSHLESLPDRVPEAVDRDGVRSDGRWVDIMETPLDILARERARDPGENKMDYVVHETTVPLFEESDIPILYSGVEFSDQDPALRPRRNGPCDIGGADPRAPLHHHDRAGAGADRLGHPRLALGALDSDRVLRVRHSRRRRECNDRARVCFGHGRFCRGGYRSPLSIPPTRRSSCDFRSLCLRSLIRDCPTRARRTAAGQQALADGGASRYEQK